MSTCLYLVIKVRDSWYVDCEGKPYGPCPTKDEAIHGAHELVRVFGDPERNAEIWVPNEGGKMCLEWKSSTASRELS